MKFFVCLQCPRTTDEWKVIAEEYLKRWHFPNTVGSLDGKHIKIRKPSCSGSTYFNYKHTFSIVLLAVADANYRFLFVDVGSQGRCSDAGVFSESHLNKALQLNALHLPPPAEIPGTREKMPFWLLADDAFPLRDHILKPYPQRNLSHDERIYNYRLSRGRMCIENAFGILCNRFRVLLNPICLSPSKVDTIVLACCAMHNMLRSIAPSRYVLPQENANNRVNNGENNLEPARVGGRRSATKRGKEIRDFMCRYFVSPEGEVPWQESMI